MKLIRCINIERKTEIIGNKTKTCNLSHSLRIDSYFARISQALTREKNSAPDTKEEVRYSVKRIIQLFYTGNFVCLIERILKNEGNSFEYLSF